ncbi:UNVERIFIED_CONTAM: hypothetical protein LI988_08820, partial [Campylobacter jejuni]
GEYNEESIEGEGEYGEEDIEGEGGYGEEDIEGEEEYDEEGIEGEEVEEKPTGLKACRCSGDVNDGWKRVVNKRKSLGIVT